MFLEGMKGQWVEGARRILLGDDTGGEAIGFQCAEVRVSVRIPFIQPTHIFVYTCTQTRLALDLPERIYCVKLGSVRVAWLQFTDDKKIASHITRIFQRAQSKIFFPQCGWYPLHFTSSGLHLPGNQRTQSVE
jgi:hypothetical protein